MWPSYPSQAAPYVPQAAGKAERLTVAANPSQPLSMRIATLNHRQITLLLASLLLAALWAPGAGYAQTIVVIVNDEPITSFDVDQRMRWAAITHNFGEHMKALLSGDKINQQFRQMMIAAQPHSQAEAQAGRRANQETTRRGRQAPRARGGRRHIAQSGYRRPHRG